MKKKTKQDQKIDKILSLPSSVSEDDKIKQVMQGLKYKIILALMDELRNGKGIARIQAAQELERLNKEIAVTTDTIIKIEFDAFATAEASTA